MNPEDFKSNDEIAWCPGCGNFSILKILKDVLAQSGRKPKDILLCSGIGQAAKMPHYVKANCFNGLHGRAIPVAAAAKMVNPALTVLVATGDGDCYGEGGNHFIHNIRRNIDITVIVSDNQIYGLTKGQASPTSDEGIVTKVQTEGVILEPFHPLEMAIAAGCGFAARGFIGKPQHLRDIILAGIGHKGFSLIDVLSPCVSFNRKNTFKWYSERIYELEEGYNASDRMAALEKAMQWGDRIPVGIIYKEEKPDYLDKAGLSRQKPLIDASVDDIDISSILSELAV